jgi:recombinational DNA repair protein RecT
MSTENSSAIALTSEFQGQLLSKVETYLSDRKSNNPEFKTLFEKTAADMLFSQTTDGLEAIKKARPLALFNAIFEATEIGASFAKKEISVIPFAAMVTTKVGDTVSKRATGENDLTIIVDIKFQKQMILKMENCKRFFTAEVHDGVVVVEDLNTGNCIFDGVNNVTKPTIGYYAKFETTDGQIYDLFMSCAEIVDRARKNKVGFKEENYKNTAKSVHYEKIVVRNLLKIIPKVSKELSSVIAYDEQYLTEYEEVSTKPNALETAKKAEALSTAPPAETYEVDPKSAVEAFESEKPKTAAGKFF